MRKHSFADGEFYHIFNRGVERRNIFLDKTDFDRFLESMEVFNTLEPVGSLHEYRFIREKLGSPTPKLRLVRIVCFCLNPNHYHFMLEQVIEGGVSAFMQRLSVGYTNYFNKKYKRSGVLFQGKFKSTHIAKNEQLLHVSAYVNLNNRAHQLPRGVSVSSWDEYIERKSSSKICAKNIILDQFKSIAEYKNFAESSLLDILERKQESKELQAVLLE